MKNGTQKKKNRQAGFEVLIYMWLSIGFIPFLMGIMDAAHPSLFSACQDPWSRIEYVFPQFRIGCYLGSPPNLENK